MTAEEYAAYAFNVYVTIGEDEEKSFEDYIREAFEAGMQEKEKQIKKQIKKNIIRGIAHLDVDHSPYEIVIKAEEIQNLKHGTLVKFIIIK